MIALTVPGYGELELAHLVLDYNGTLACDGKVIDGVSVLLPRLAASLIIHIITADTFGTVEQMFAGSPYNVHVLPGGAEDRAKQTYVRELEAGRVVAVGNGRNDCLMLKEAALGIALIQEEGAATQALLAADMVCRDILDALDLLLHPLRLKATLRC